MPNPPCNVCGKVISGSPYNLKMHQRTHSGKKPHKCSVDGCVASFAQQANLVAHMRKHNDERPYKCSVVGCDKRFKGWTSRKHHEQTHNDEKPHACDFEGCTFRCNQLSDMQAHKRKHTGERPFECDVDGCQYSCTRSSILAEHKRTHTGEKRFECPFEGCGYKALQGHHLQSHVRMHTGHRPFVCDFEGCDAAFYTSGNLAVHKQAWHTNEGIQRRKKQEEAMKNALVLGGYVESFERGRVPAPGQFTREVYFDHRCALARDFMPGEKKYAYVDFVVTTHDGRVVFLEVDEEQHGYNSQLCETTRMWNICESIVLADLGGEMNVFWLRINPNVGYHVGGRTLKTSRELRFQEVVKFLDNLKSSPSDPMMQIGYAYYHCESNGKPLVLKDPEYHPDVAKSVVCISKGSQKLIQPCEFPPVNPLFAPVDWTQPIEEMQEAPDSEDEDVPSGEAGGSSGKRARVR